MRFVNSCRARYIKVFGLPTGQVPVAYNYLAVSVLTYPGAQFFPNALTVLAEHIALAVVHSAPMYSFSSDIGIRLGLVGAWVACRRGVARMASASRFQVVLMVPDVRLSPARVASARRGDSAYMQLCIGRLWRCGGCRRSSGRAQGFRDGLCL